MLRTILYNELEEHVELRLFGAFLGLLEPLVAYYWIFRLGALGHHAPHHHQPPFLSIHQPALCSPVWQDCAIVRHKIVPHDKWFAYGIAAMAAFGLLSSICFAVGGRKRVWLAHAFMIIAVITKCIFLLLDFRLEHNAHKMALWTSLAFLFLPHKRDTCRVLLSSFYFWAGWLKTNPEWLSGAALMGGKLWPTFLFPPTIVPAACAYVVVLELVSTWGLLCDGIWLGWALLQFVMFHVSSFTVVSYFYPFTMFLLLSIVPIISIVDWQKQQSEKTCKQHQSLSLFRRFFSGRAPLVTYAVCFLFAYCNIIPSFYPGDKAISGEGRILALHMYDANVLCNHDSIKHRNLQSDLVPLDSHQLLPIYRRRSLCDPYVVMQMAKATCDYLETLPNYYETQGQYIVDVELFAKRATDSDFTTVVREQDVCRRFVVSPSTPFNKSCDTGNFFRYKWWTHNDWIFPGRQESNNKHNQSVSRSTETSEL